MMTITCWPSTAKMACEEALPTRISRGSGSVRPFIARRENSGQVLTPGSDSGGKLEGAFIVLAGGGELHATDGAGNGDDRDACEAEWGGVAEDSGAERS